jgi:hypothetical protein
MLLMAHMRTLLRGSGSATFLALLVAGLGGCTSGAQSTNMVPGTTTALASQLASAFCAAQAACCGSPAGTADGSVNHDAGGAATTSGCGVNANAAATDGGPSTCLDRATLSANQQLALVTTALGEGLLTINGGTATTCVDAYATTSCATLAGQTEPDVQAALDNPVCAGLFTGYIPVGERCDMTEECVGGAYCLSQGTGQPVNSIAGSGTLGVCFPFVGMDGACNTTDDCLPPLACNATTLTCE